MGSSKILHDIYYLLTKFFLHYVYVFTINKLNLNNNYNKRVLCQYKTNIGIIKKKMLCSTRTKWKVTRCLSKKNVTKKNNGLCWRISRSKNIRKKFGRKIETKFLSRLRPASMVGEF